MENLFKNFKGLLNKKKVSVKEIIETYYDIPKKLPTYKIKQLGFVNKKELINFYTETFLNETSKTPKEFLKGLKISYSAKIRSDLSKKIKKQKFTSQSVIKRYNSSNQDELANVGLLRQIIKDNNITGNNRIIFTFNNTMLRDVTTNIGENPSLWWETERLKFLYVSPYYMHQYPLATKTGSNWNMEIIITPNLSVKPKYIIQNFLDGVNTHCFFQPILDWCYSVQDNTKSSKMVENMNSIINKITKKISTTERYGYLEKYKNGIPETDIQKVIDDLRISVSIEQPFCNTPYIRLQSQRKALKVFKFINTRTNHIVKSDIHNFDTIHKNDFKDVIILTREELREKQTELDNNNIEYIYKKDKLGVCVIKCINEVYAVDNDFITTIEEFMNDTGLSDCGIDAKKYPILTRFLKKGTNYNGTIDFKNNVNQQLLIDDDEKIKHIDMTKAYTQFKKSKYYTGFVGKITDFRAVDNYTQKGLYYIDDINLIECNEQFIKLNNSLNWFRNKNIYTDAELTALTDMGGKFKVKYGAYGIKLDFEFNSDMLNKKEYQFTDDEGNEIRLPYYSKFCGLMGRVQKKKKFYMKGKRDYFEQIRFPETTELLYPTGKTDDIMEGTIIMNKDTAIHKLHITAQITAYQRLNILEQLLNMDYDSLIRVCVDGIYYYDHKFKMNDTFRDKHDERNFKNAQTENGYLSMVNMCVDGEFKPIGKDGNIIQPRDFYKTELFLGGGGCGKTYLNLVDEGLINVIYIAPSWKLASYKRNEFNNLSVSVLHRMVNEPYTKELIGRYNNYIIDEGSFIKQYEKEYILKNCTGKIIFCGDLGFQIDPVVTQTELKLVGSGKMKKEDIQEMDKKGFDKITYCTTNYRSGSCKKLMTIINTLREMIKSNFKGDINAVVEEVKKATNTITISDLKNQYDKDDLILGSEHNICDYYTNLFKHIEKYRVMNNTRDYRKGEIVFNKINNVDMDIKHGYTIHSIQGETAKKRLYIDPTKTKSLRMLYTAISRAKLLEQIYFIV